MARIEDMRGLGNVGTYANAEARHQLAEERVPLRIIGVTDDPLNRYGARKVVSVVDLGSGEVIAIGFKVADNPGRAAFLDRVAAVLTAGDAIDPVVLTMEEPREPGGNPFWAFRTATDDELTAEGINPDIEPHYGVGAEDPDADPVVLPGEKLRKAGKAAS